MTTASITLTPERGPGSRVTIAGHDITNAVHALTVSAEVGRIPTITLDLAVVDVTSLDADHTQILIPDHTRHALIALGWTPPGQPAV